MHAAFSTRSRHGSTDRPSTLALLSRVPKICLGYIWTSLGAGPAWMRRTILVCVILLVGIVGYASIVAQGMVASGLVVAGVPVGGLTYEEAHERLQARAAAFEEQRVILQYEDNVWTPTLKELGITMDVDLAWQTVQSFGSNRYLVQRTLRALHISSGTTTVQVPISVDRPSLQAYCIERMRELDLAPVDASLTVDGSTILVTDDIGGFEISVDKLQTDLVRELRGFTQPTIVLQANYSVADVRRTELQAGATALGRALDNPLTLYTETDQWQVDPDQLSEHLSLGEDGDTLSLVVDEEAIDLLVEEIAGQIDQSAREPSLSEAEPYARIVAAQTGYEVNRVALKTRIMDAINSGDDEVEIPLIVTEVDDDIRPLLNEYGITDLIATGSSDFSGSDGGRDTNVRLAAKQIDGTLIAPGEVFSFNQALGSIVDVEGFVPAGATEGGIPGTAVGGGVCQVSTSIFRAALQAGFPIEEWWPHAYRSIYYEQGGWAPGFDASIQQPDDDPLGGPDLKFRNTTDGWLLIRVTATAGSELKVSLFGTNPGYSVFISDPTYLDIVSADEIPIEEVDTSLPEGSSELWQPARDGVTMVVYRTVYAADGSILLDESFVSTYQPQGPVYRISPDMVGSTPFE